MVETAEFMLAVVSAAFLKCHGDHGFFLLGSASFSNARRKEIRHVSAKKTDEYRLPISVPQVALIAVLIFSSGCAEGVFWRMGRFSPRVVERWEQEEQITNSVFERKRQMTQTAVDARAQGGSAMNEAARELGRVALTEPVLINRMEAINQLAKLDCPSTWEVLRRAISDPDEKVRLAVVHAWKSMSSDQAVPELARILESDSSVDVRLATVRALGQIPGNNALVPLQKALRDADPAIQLRATQSLALITGEKLGPDVRAWSAYLDKKIGDSRSATNSSGQPTIR